MKSPGYFITGTDTGVGKTVVTACLVSLLRKVRLDVGVMKPIETGVDPDCNSAANSDARFLMEVAGSEDDLSDVCPLRLKAAASPYQAAAMENRKIDLPRILESFHKLSGRHEFMLVEGIGGIQVPITHSYRVTDLIRDLGLPVIVVGRVTLGTLNHTLLTLQAAAIEGLEVRGVILNHPQAGEPTDIEQDQAKIIEELSGVPVLGECPFLGQVSAECFAPEAVQLFAERIRLDLPGMGAFHG